MDVFWHPSLACFIEMNVVFKEVLFLDFNDIKVGKGTLALAAKQYFAF